MATTTTVPPSQELLLRAHFCHHVLRFFLKQFAEAPLVFLLVDQIHHEHLLKAPAAAAAAPVPTPRRSSSDPGEA